MRLFRKTRYFFISYRTRQGGYGDIAFQCSKMFSINSVAKQLGLKKEDLVILNMFEFYSKKDYTNFVSDGRNQHYNV